MRRQFWASVVVIAVVIGVVIGVRSDGSSGATAQSDNDVIEARVAGLEARVKLLETQVAGGTSGTDPQTEPAMTERLVALWTEREGEGTADCDEPSGLCAYKLDWEDLTINDDGTYEWIRPYATGSYTVAPRGTRGDLAVKLEGAGNFVCTATYFVEEDLLEMLINQCPGIRVESQYERGNHQELTNGRILYSPVR